MKILSEMCFWTRKFQIKFCKSSRSWFGSETGSEWVSGLHALSKCYCAVSFLFLYLLLYAE